MAAYEWNETKAIANLRTHGISFAEAIKSFEDPFAIEWPDTRFAYGEDRTILIGPSGRAILTIAYTERADAIRIISARQATKHERDHYHRQNPP